MRRADGMQLNTVGGRAALALAAGAISAVVLVYGYMAYGYRFLEKYPPDWSVFGLIKALVLVLASVLLYRALAPAPDQQRATEWTKLPAGAVAVGALIPLASALAVILTPEVIGDYVREQKLLSIFTEVVFIAALFVLGRTAWISRSRDLDPVLGIRPQWLLWPMIAVVFLILMEEMSWGQHWLGFATPERFEGNLQGETNLHNFYTYRFEAAYYSTAVLAFVVLPFAWPREVPGLLSRLTVLVPPPALAIAALPLTGLFYEAWNYALYQIWFYLGLLIALRLYRSEPAAEHRHMILIAMASMVLSQAVFLRFGFAMPDGHELTEIREFAIALCILAYGLILSRRLRPSTD